MSGEFEASMDEVSLDQQIDMTIKAIRGVITLEKPALKAKTFAKLPIRFVHEVVTAIMQCTGFGDTLFEDRPELQNFSEQFKKSQRTINNDQNNIKKFARLPSF